MDTKEGTDVNPANQGCNGVSDSDIGLDATALEGEALRTALKAAAARDEGKTLRAVATYTDGHGIEKKAVGVSANTVRAEVSSQNDNVENQENGSPGFPSGSDYSRTVAESLARDMPVGDPVVAVDPNDDTLTYMMATTTGDSAFFKIDKATGQISVKKTLDYDDNANAKYKFDIVATDPSGESDDVEVTINVTDANDAPDIMGSVRVSEFVLGQTVAAPFQLRVYEKDDDDENNDGSPDYDGTPDMTVRSLLGDKNVFTASDEDARGQIFWDLKGEDADDFVVSSTGIQLTGYVGPDEPIAVRFKDAPDYEVPTDDNADSVYKVTLVARDSAGAEDEHDITVFVDNVNEAGEATLSTDQPLVGQAVTASVSDPDNGVTIVTWQWERATSTSGVWKPIPGATTDTYVPWKKDEDDDEDIVDDDSMFLRATATYIDVTSQIDDTSETGKVDERVQMGVDDLPVAKMASTTKTGIATVTTTEDGNPVENDTRLYRVRVTSKNAVRVSDETPDNVPVFRESGYDRAVVENAETGSIVGVPVEASYVGDLEYYIYNADANDNSHFEIDIDSGQIRVGSRRVPSPTPRDQYGVPDDAVGLLEDVDGTLTPSDKATTTDPVLDYEAKDTYTLVITAEDADNSSKKASVTVTVSLVDRNEAPYFDKESRDKVGFVNADTGTSSVELIDYAENQRTEVVALAAIEPDGASLRWELRGADAARFEIEDVPDGAGNRDRRKLVFKDQPNYESAKDSGKNNVYDVIVRATEETAVGGGPAKADELTVKVRVTDVDEAGKVTLNWLQPEVGTMITATTTDPEGVGGTGNPPLVEYTWYRSKVTTPDDVSPGATEDDLAVQWEKIESEWSEQTQTNEATPRPLSDIPGFNCGGDGVANARNAEGELVANVTPLQVENYTPQGDCAGSTGPDSDETKLGLDEVDVGRFLLVRAVYEDRTRNADGDVPDDNTATSTAIGVSAYPVRADVADEDNNSPDFRGARTTRTVPEDTPVGDPVSSPVMVDINEDDDVLTYEIVAKVKTGAVAENQGQELNDPDYVDETDGHDSVVFADLAYFSIDAATGQLMVKKKLSFEDSSGVEAGEYTVVVRATDPSGEIDREENRDDIVVKVVATDVDEKPGVDSAYGLTELWVNEADSTDKDFFLGLEYHIDTATGLYLHTPDDPVTETDETAYGMARNDDGDVVATTTNNNLFKRQEEDLVDSTRWPEPIGGADGSLFEYSVPADAQGIGRRIHFKESPDFENPMDANRDNVYEVTITVVDSTDLMGERKLRITVLNVDEKGKLTLSPAQPHVGGTVTAVLTDPDCDPGCGTTITDWDWIATTTSEIPSGYDFATASTTDIIVNTTDRYMIRPKLDEGLVGKFLWAMVSYRDGASVEDDPVTLMDERNDDLATVGPDGQPRTGDGDELTNLRANDVIETKHNSDETRSDTSDNAVQKDPAGADPSDFPTQTINLSIPESLPSTGYVGMPVLGYDAKVKEDDQHDPKLQDPRVNVGGPDASLFVFAEDFDNAEDDADSDLATFPDDGFAVYYDKYLQGMAEFDDATPLVETAGGRKDYGLDKYGQLALMPVTHLDHEAAKNSYTIEVMDADAANELGVITVIITVTDVNEAPSKPAEHFGPGTPANTAPQFLDANDDVATSTYRMVAENTAAGTDIGDPVAATDVDSGDSLTYELGGTDAASFAIDAETGQIATSAALDYETKMEHMVTVTATDDEGADATITVTIMVTDEVIGNKADDYDDDKNEMIDGGEVLQAVRDYFDEVITGPEVLAVVRAYFQNL